MVWGDGGGGTYRIVRSNIGFAGIEGFRRVFQQSMCGVDTKQKIRILFNRRFYLLVDTGDWDIYEHLHNTTAFSDIDAVAKLNRPGLVQTYIPHNAVNTPVTMRTTEDLHLSFHEVNLTDVGSRL